MSFIPTWLIVGFVMLVILIILFRTMDQVWLLSMIKDNFFYVFAFLVFIFLAFSLMHINNKYDLDFSSGTGWSKAGKIYLNWLVGVGKNLGKVTGFVVQQNWTDTSINNSGG